MPKGDKGRKNGTTRTVREKAKSELLLKFDGTIYGQCIRILGECNFTVFCFDGVERLCHLRKKVKKGEKVEVDTIVLVGLRDYQDDKGDIVFVYNKEHTSQLKAMREIPSKIASASAFAQENEDVLTVGDETGFDFEAI